MRRLMMAAILAAVGCAGDGDPDPGPSVPECIVLVSDGERCNRIRCCWMGETHTEDFCTGQSRCVSCGRTSSGSCVVDGEEHSCGSMCDPGNQEPPPARCLIGDPC